MADPAARPLTLADRDRFDGSLGRVAAAPSEYRFANLYLFRKRHHYRLTERPVPHVAGITYDGRRHALPLVDVDAAGAAALLADAELDCLHPLGGDAAARLAGDAFAASCEAADSDYLFDASDLATLARSGERRRQARLFERDRRPVLEPWTGRSPAQAEAVLAGWCADVGRAPERTDIAECREAIALVDDLALEGRLVRAGTGEPIAFLLASRAADGERVIHFAKGRRAFDGCYPWLFSRYAAEAPGLVNFEQDLGNPGLAQSKRAYAPAARRDKHRIGRARPAVQ